MEFCGQDYWNGLPFPSPGDLSDPGIKPTSPELQADSLSLSHQGKGAPVLKAIIAISSHTTLNMPDLV